MKILLTGHKGFVGEELLKKLTAHQVVTIDKQDGVDLLTCDLPDVDLVIHLAGASGIGYSLENPKHYWDNNVMVTKRIFDRYKSIRVMYASSSTAKEPVRNPYAMTKHTMERMAPQTSLGLRFCTIYNDSQKRPNMLFPRLFRNELKYIHTNHQRDFIHIDDITDAICFLMNRPVTGVLDIGTGGSTPLKKITDYFDLEVEERIGDDTERLCNKADVSKLKELGWSSKIELFDCLNKQKDLTL